MGHNDEISVRGACHKNMTFILSMAVCQTDRERVVLPFQRDYITDCGGGALYHHQEEGTGAEMVRKTWWTT